MNIRRADSGVGFSRFPSGPNHPHVDVTISSLIASKGGLVT